MIGRKNIDRILIVGLFTAVIWAILFARLFQVQVLYAAEYRDKARYQHQKKRPVPAIRGSIFDRNGVPLARNSTAYDFWTRPSLVRDIDRIDSVFCEILGGERGIYKAKIDSAHYDWVFLARNVELSKAEKLSLLQADSVFSYEVHDRVYPRGQTASQIIGFVDPDGNGLDGIEYSYNRRLAGVDGEVIVLSDASGRDYQIFQYGGNPPFLGRIYT